MQNAIFQLPKETLNSDQHAKSMLKEVVATTRGSLTLFKEKLLLSQKKMDNLLGLPTTVVAQIRSENLPRDVMASIKVFGADFYAHTCYHYLLEFCLLLRPLGKLLGLGLRETWHWKRKLKKWLEKTCLKIFEVMNYYFVFRSYWIFCVCFAILGNTL